MADIKTIDEILRKRGQEKLSQEIKNLFAPIIDSGIVGREDSSALWAGLYDSKGEMEHPNPWRGYHGEITCKAALNAIKKAIYDRDVTKYEQAEVDTFLKKLDGVSEEIESLRNEVLG